LTKKLSENERYLIINADDFGMCHSANVAIMQMFEDGVITSASLMPVCPWFEEAKEFASQQQSDIGAHLTFTSEWKYYKWGALTNKESLQDSGGYLPSDCITVEERAKREDVISEMWKQIEKLKDANINLTHIDNHMGSLYGLNIGNGILPEIFEICNKLNLPFRFPKNFPQERLEGMPKEVVKSCEMIVDLAEKLNVGLLDYLIEYPFHMLEGEDFDSYKDMIKNKIRGLKAGISELYIHPAVDGEEIRCINPSWEKRIMEYLVFYEDDVQNIIREEGIKIIPWADFS
jgi:predicted glycoside hydrolase/deacetylase ChbG (UPF0249 family)